MNDQQNIPLLKKKPILLLSLAIFILIISGGYLYYRYDENIIRREQCNNVKSIADLSGVRVLSDIFPVPGSPWFMIAKVDQSEIFSEIKYRTVIVIIITLLLLLSFSFGISWYYNNRQKSIYSKSCGTRTIQQFIGWKRTAGDPSLGLDLEDLTAEKMILIEHVRVERSEIEEAGE